MEQRGSINSDLHTDNGQCARRRNWAGFWLLGLCNNFAYVVMLSAAHDILKQQESGNATVPATAAVSAHLQAKNSSIYDCNPVTTGAVLLADILPTLVIKMFAPFVIHKVPYGARVLFCAITAAASLLLVSFSSAVWMSILGVVFTSISAGLGELSFLSLTVFFRRDVLGGWGSGTGGAGLAGAILYSGLVQVGLSPQIALRIMLVIPVLMLVSYFILLVPPPSFPQWSRSSDRDYVAVRSEDRRRLLDGSEEEQEQERSAFEDGTTGPLSLKEKCQIIKSLLKFVIPLGLVYFAEYFINQGLMELLFFHNIFLSHAAQYRWYQTLYQAGVLISRSSLCCFKIRRLWVLSLLQVLNAVFLLFSVGYRFLPNVWIVFAIILFEGLLGGAAYVNTFYFISEEMKERDREFAMAAASVGDSLGIAVAGFVSFPVHNHFCSL